MSWLLHMLLLGVGIQPTQVPSNSRTSESNEDFPKFHYINLLRIPSFSLISIQHCKIAFIHLMQLYNKMVSRLNYDPNDVSLCKSIVVIKTKTHSTETDILTAILVNLDRICARKFRVYSVELNPLFSVIILKLYCLKWYH